MSHYSYCTRPFRYDGYQNNNPRECSFQTFSKTQAWTVDKYGNFNSTSKGIKEAAQKYECDDKYTHYESFQEDELQATINMEEGDDAEPYDYIVDLHGNEEYYLEEEWQEEDNEGFHPYDFEYYSVVICKKNNKINDIVLKTEEMESEMEKDFLLRFDHVFHPERKEYMGSDRPPPFDFDSNDPPMPLTRDQLQAGDTICVYDPNSHFWYINYVFGQIVKDDWQHQMELISCDSRIDPEKRRIHIPCESVWPVIYKHIVPSNSEISFFFFCFTVKIAHVYQSKNFFQIEGEEEVGTIVITIDSKAEQIVQSEKIGTNEEIEWEGMDANIIKELQLCWNTHKNSFLRCLSLLSKQTVTPLSYETLALLSGAGIHLQWKEEAQNTCSTLDDINPQIQLVEKATHLRIEKILTNEPDQIIDDGDVKNREDILTRHVKQLELRTIESLKKKILVRCICIFVLTHDENGNFAILCGYKPLQSLQQEIQYIGNPADYIFLLKKFVSNEELAVSDPRQSFDRISVSSRKYVVFVTVSTETKTSDKIQLLKKALETIVQVWDGSEKQKTKDTSVPTHNNENDKTQQHLGLMQIPENNENTATIQKVDIVRNSEILPVENPISSVTQVERTTSFGAWTDSLTQKPMTNDVYRFSCQHLMVLQDARNSLINWFNSLVETLEVSNIKNELDAVVSALKNQTLLITRLDEKHKLFGTFNGKLTDFMLPRSAPQQNDTHREELLSTVQQLSHLEAKVIKYYKTILRQLSLPFDNSHNLVK
ncbi:hypothetical protein RFI_11186 [Reticulomyxa filosa]|uniref:Uncharacterized protein n=1 Tax=Reticulomyxa filosa TaxID=46433 RepID=X6NIZ9_RETFI|nr:hypothetical protein RFI_11186 [Reticulomyxa filosa]|eukprot:ETO25951.1 hypothetical protein RFI_11186 [Reticulomyxa filosa]